jgi:predicted nucleic acid-binding protein
MVVANSSPLMALARLDLLRLLPSRFDEVLIPDVVLSECTAQTQRPGARAILAAREARTLEAVPVPEAERFAAAHLLDPGEAAALLLAQERSCPALVDERRGWRVAAQLGIPVVGTLGVLLAARKAGEVPALPPPLEALMAFGYRLPPDLARETLRRAGEA